MSMTRGPLTLRSWKEMDLASTSFPNCRIRSVDFDIILCFSAVPQLRLLSSDRKSSAASVLTNLLCITENSVRWHDSACQRAGCRHVASHMLPSP